MYLICSVWGSMYFYLMCSMLCVFLSDVYSVECILLCFYLMFIMQYVFLSDVYNAVCIFI